MYRAHRCRALLCAALALAVAYTVFGPGSHVLDGRAVTHNGQQGAYGSENHLTVSWPRRGQAAFVLGDRRPKASPDERPVAIASLAKVMTAYLTLERYPLTGAQDGFVIAVTAAEAQAVAQDRAEGQSVVAVAPGEELSERQLLEALLIPSGNNIADLLAAQVAGSETRFVAEMNAQARALRMDDTTYTDPSGFDASTVSTAADQLRIFEQAMRFSVFREIVATGSVTLPVAGMVMNLDPLIVEEYAGKTGSDSAAGGCLAFFTDVTAGGRWQTVVGVVLGQGQGSETQTLLAAAGQAAQQLVASATDATSVGSVASPVAGGRRSDGGRGDRRHLLDPSQPLPPN